MRYALKNNVEKITQEKQEDVLLNVWKITVAKI